jgi:hypothetical protein
VRVDPEPNRTAAGLPNGISVTTLVPEDNRSPNGQMMIFCNVVFAPAGSKYKDMWRDVEAHRPDGHTTHHDGDSAKAQNKTVTQRTFL